MGVGSTSSVSSGQTKATSSTYNHGTISSDGGATGCSAFDEGTGVINELYHNQATNSSNGNNGTPLRSNVPISSAAISTLGNNIQIYKNIIISICIIISYEYICGHGY